MNWIPVILAFAVLGAIGLIFGLVLEFADKKLKVETDGIVRAAPYAVVALLAEPRIVNLLHGRKGFCLVLFDGLYVETHQPEAIIATLSDRYGAL